MHLSLLLTGKAWIVQIDDLEESIAIGHGRSVASYLHRKINLMHRDRN